MKIIYFIDSLSAGGKERRLVELINGLVAVPDFVCKIVVIDKHLQFSGLIPDSVDIQVLERKFVKKDIRIFFNFYRLCKKYSPDIIHVWQNMPAFYAIPASLGLGIPIVNSQIADTFGLVRSGLFSYITHRINFKLARVIISNTITGLKSYKLDGNKCRVINNGVSLSRFRVHKDAWLVKSEFGIQTHFVVIMTGSFSKFKNFDLFLDVAKSFQTVRKDISFIAVGSGDNFSHIKSRIKDEGIINVILTGFILDVEELLSVCDIGMLLSPFGEGMSNSLMEYMASGIPVIASDKGGTHELVKNEVNGFIIEDESPERINECIQYLIDNEKVRLDMGKRNSKLIEENYRIEKMVAQFLKVYEMLLTR
jgi:glycosyltransferase involved in cell wall biosynthesis